MSSGCYFSSGCFQTRDLEEVVAQALAHGLGIELSSGLSAPDTLDPVFAALGRIPFLVHNYFPAPDTPFVLNLASTDPEIRRLSMALCQRAIDLCAKLKAPFYSVHAGFALNLRPEDLGQPERQAALPAGRAVPRQAAYRSFLATVQELACYASARGVGLLVENNVVARENLAADGSSALLLGGPEELAQFCREVGDPGVGLLLDTGHTKVSAATLGIAPERYFAELGPFLKCLHLSDNDGERDTNAPFTDAAWFAPFLKAAASLPMVIEVYRITPGQMLQLAAAVERMVSGRTE